MFSEDDANQRLRRQSFLTVLLVSMLSVFLIFCLILITGGLFLYVVLAVAGLGAFAGVHYLLWGKSFSEAVADETEEEALRRRAAGEK